MTESVMIKDRIRTSQKRLENTTLPSASACNSPYSPPRIGAREKLNFKFRDSTLLVLIKMSQSRSRD